ncbi:hypothetical protein B0H13DRAFT_1883688 [Mycena leptocephala]|nr:hypothetical protein B0H13DRAFT_1883688 [Mycena leptocephala]
MCRYADSLWITPLRIGYRVLVGPDPHLFDLPTLLPPAADDVRIRSSAFGVPETAHSLRTWDEAGRVGYLWRMLVLAEMYDACRPPLHCGRLGITAVYLPWLREHCASAPSSDWMERRGSREMALRSRRRSSFLLSSSTLRFLGIPPSPLRYVTKLIVVSLSFTLRRAFPSVPQDHHPIIVLVVVLEDAKVESAAAASPCVNAATVASTHAQDMQSGGNFVTRAPTSHRPTSIQIAEDRTGQRCPPHVTRFLPRTDDAHTFSSSLRPPPPVSRTPIRTLVSHSPIVVGVRRCAAAGGAPRTLPPCGDVWCPVLRWRAWSVWWRYLAPASAELDPRISLANDRTSLLAKVPENTYSDLWVG